MKSTSNHIELTHQHYHKIARAIEFIRTHHLDQPSLKQVADHIHLSEYHTQRVFTEWAGVSPKQYLQYLTKENAKRHLREVSVLDSAVASGLSGSARLHDLMINFEGMTPGDYKRFGKNLLIEFGFAQSPYGDCLIAWTGKGICRLVFMHEQLDKAAAIEELDKEWSSASFSENTPKAIELCGAIFGESGANQSPLNLHLKGTVFQMKVWEALLHIPDGELRSYEQVALSMGSPNGTRAVASAIAKNNIGWLIPCHRVIRKGGEFSNYRWGQTRKAAMIARELSAHSG